MDELLDLFKYITTDTKRTAKTTADAFNKIKFIFLLILFSEILQAQDTDEFIEWFEKYATEKEKNQKQKGWQNIPHTQKECDRVYGADIKEDSPP